jgi:hypothetical protein
MKNTWLRLTAVTAMAGGMLLATAQDVPNQPAPPAATQQHQRMHQRAARLAQYLNLTAAQKDRAKQAFLAAHQNAQPIREQLKQVHMAMFQAVRANDAAKIDQLSAQEGNLKGQLGAIRNETFAKLYSSLTPDQQAKADQIPAHLRQMRQRRMQKAPNANNG